MRSMQWQLGILGTISAFAYRHKETKKNPCRGGRSQDLPNTDFQPAVNAFHHGYKKQSVTYKAKVAVSSEIRTEQCKTSTMQNF